MATYETKKIKELRRKLMSLNFEEADLALRRVRGEVVPPAQAEKIQRRREEISDFLDIYKTRHLIHKAESWGIEVPYKEEWHRFQTKYPEPGKVTGGVYWTIKESLNSLGIAVITKQIREARRASVKWWIDVLIPVMALAVAIGAVFRDAIIAFINAHR